MKKQMFLKNAAVLTFINMLGELIHLYIEIFFSKSLGSQGVGLFQLMMSVFGLAATIGMGGYSIAVTRLVTKNTQLYSLRSAKSAARKAMLTAFFTGLLVCVCLIFFAEKICLNWIKDIRVMIPLKILALSLPVSAVSICLNSYYISTDRIKTIGISILFSQIINVIFAVKLLEIFSFSFTGKCIAIALSTILTDILGLILRLIFFVMPFSKSGEKLNKTSFKDVLSISLPIGVSGTLRSFLNMLQNMLIPYGLIKFGLSEGEAMSNYGLIKGMAIPVVVFPATLMSSFLALLIPEVSRAYETGDRGKIGRAIVKSSSVTILFSIALTGIYAVYGEELGMLIYDNAKAGKYIRILAPLTTFMFLDDVVDSILKGMNEQMRSLEFNIIESLVRVLLLFVLVPRIGVVGYVFVIFFGNILNFAMSYNRLSKIADIYIDIKNWIVKPIFAVVVSLILSKLLLYTLGVNFITVITSISFTLLLYMVICLKMNCLKDIF